MINLPNITELTEVQKLRIQRNFLSSQKEQLERSYYTDPPGTYGTAASRNSEARWQARRLGEKIDELDQQIALLEKQVKGI